MMTEKINAVIRRFLNQASNLQTSNGVKSTIIVKAADNYGVFCVMPTDNVCNHDTLEISLNVEALFSDELLDFYKHWANKNPILTNFSPITFCLLHELGHFATGDAIRKTFPLSDRLFSLAFLEYKEKNAYYELPDEKAASKWALEWLSDENNHPLARVFEEKFFSLWD